MSRRLWTDSSVISAPILRRKFNSDSIKNKKLLENSKPNFWRANDEYTKINLDFFFFIRNQFFRLELLRLLLEMSFNVDSQSFFVFDGRVGFGTPRDFAHDQNRYCCSHRKVGMRISRLYLQLYTELRPTLGDINNVGATRRVLSLITRFF